MTHLRQDRPNGPWTDGAILRESEAWAHVPPSGVLIEDAARLLVHLPTRRGASSRVWRSRPNRKGAEVLILRTRIAAQSPGFRITYEHVVATDSAVIALARPSEPVNRIREVIRERLRLPSETRNEADLVHTTLFRYRGRLSDPAKLLAMLEKDMSADATAEVDELVLSRELVYPSLEAQMLARLPPASR